MGFELPWQLCVYRQDSRCTERWVQKIPTSSFQSSVPHSSVAALHAPIRTTTGTEVMHASKHYVQQLGEHWEALQAARRISICQSDKLKQSISTQALWSRYCDGTASALLVQAGMKKRNCWAGSTSSQHPKGKLSSARKPQHYPRPPCAIFLASPCTAVAVGLCTCKQCYPSSSSLVGVLPALAQNLTIQVNLKFL